MNKNALSFPEREYKKEKQNPDGSETYWCPVCKNYLEPELFFRHYRKKHGISSTCRGCTTGIKHKKTPLKRRKLDYMGRSNVNGFVKYFSERKYLFKDVFHVEYTEETAIEKFYQASEKRK